MLALVVRAIRPKDLLEAFRHASVELLALAALAAFGFIVARAWRYRLLLGRERTPAARSLLAITLAAWGVSLVVPGPTGDGAFVWLARKRLQAPVPLGAMAVLVARALDVASLLLIALLTASVVGVVLANAARGLAAALALVSVALLLTVLWSRPRRWLVRRMLSPGSVGRLAIRINPALEELGGAGGARAIGLVVSTGATRGFSALQYLSLFAAIGHPLSLWQVWFALSVRTLLLALPLQGFGGLGTSQLWWTGALTLLGWPLETALPASLAVHLLDLAISLPQGAAGWMLLYGPRSNRQPIELTLETKEKVHASGSS